MQKIICIYCKNEFEQGRKDKVYCSRNCKQNASALRTGRNIRRRPYRKNVKCKCELCGFVPVHICQLDVDHIDGNKKNNSIENLQTLCANCHRLKTHYNKDNVNINKR